MSFTVSDVVTDAIDRLTTAAGALLIAALAVAGVVQTAGWHDLFRAAAERLLALLESPEAQAELTPGQITAAEEAIELFIADLTLALGLGPALAAALVLLGYVLALVVVVFLIDAIALGRSSPGELGVERVGWKTANLLLGSIVFGILFFIGLLLLVIPGLLVAYFLIFFAVAIVVDDESFFVAFSKSATVVRSNLLGTLALILLTIVVLVGIGLVGGLVGGLLPAIGGVILEDIISAVGQAVALAFFTCAYVAATADGADPSADAGSPAETDATRGEPADTDSIDDAPIDRSGESGHEDGGSDDRPGDAF